MALNYVGRPVDYSQLLSLLNIKSFGAPAGNIRNLKQIGLSVTYSVTDVDGLIRLLQDGVCAIIFLRTGDLPYWQHQTDHAIVVVGYDDEDQLIFLNDPYFDEAPIAVPLNDFELAWLERDYHYAVIAL